MAIERMAYELCADCAAENTVYVEARYAPHLLACELFVCPPSGVRLSVDCPLLRLAVSWSSVRGSLLLLAGREISLHFALLKDHAVVQFSRERTS